ncbi:hypothetical protein B0H13DRAFT_2000557 [Mycena leptocephala]|nr:hypothetical protein B0H13DRAFT_2000557 [Mycena leptocephala]
MSLSMDGSQVTIEGGTFNNVAGNLNQTSTTIISEPSSHRGALRSNGYPEDRLRDHGGQQSIGAHRSRTSRMHAHDSSPYSRSQRPRESRGIDPIDPYSDAHATAAPNSHSSPSPAISGVHLHPPPPDLPTGSVVQIPQPTLDVNLPRLNAENTTEPRRISNTTINSVAGNMTQLSVTTYGESGMDILYRHVVPSALHDSGERFIEPACHPGTRSKILDQLRRWSVNTSSEAPSLLWLHGTAGAGKSAIAQTFAGMCNQDGRLGGSFFFKCSHPQRGTWHGVFATLAYQLAMFSPDFCAPIQKTIEADKLLVGKALSVQFNKLFVLAFKEVTSLQRLPVIVIDGLDECEDHRIQGQILQLFIGAVQEHQIPLRILVVSRPESHLREMLSNKLDICLQLELTADDSAYEDIRNYIRHEFSRIRRERSSSGTVLEDPWPPDSAIEQLVRKSSATFVYASTVIKFVDDEYFHPDDRLQKMLQLDPQSTAPLDDLYTEILSLASRHPMLLSVLHVHIYHRGLCPALEDTDLVFNLSPGATRLCLRGLASILKIPSPTRPLQFSFPEHVEVLHSSLHDYFHNRDRSGPWCLSSPPLDLALAHHVARYLTALTEDILPNRTYRYKNLLISLIRDFGERLTTQIINVLRNESIQRLWFGHSGIMSENVHRWLERCASLPSDLKQTWMTSVFISGVLSKLRAPSINSAVPSCRFDSIYRSIFSTHPLLLEVLRMQLMPRGFSHFDRWKEDLGILGLSAKIFIPFCALSEQLADCAFPEGDGPLDFLSDIRRAGPLYEDSCYTAEKTIIRGIRLVGHYKHFSDIYLFVSYSRLLYHCRPRQAFLHELETFQLSKLCHLSAADPQVHGHFHGNRYFNGWFDQIIKWFWSLPDPPTAAIELWEREKVSFLQCSECTVYTRYSCS